jgi:hypothetical protein
MLTTGKAMLQRSMDVLIEAFHILYQCRAVNKLLI